MSLWYRVHTQGDMAKVFSGDGGLFTAGRWNHIGQKVIYCSESLALATLEWLTYNGLSVSAFVCNHFSVEVPDNLVIKFKSTELPKGWDTTPATGTSREFAGSNLYKADGPLAISVPSVMVPEEFNLVINPLHKDFKSVIGTAIFLNRRKAPLR